MKIPLTLAIIDGIITKVGNRLYSLPLTDITTFHKAKAEQITKTNNQEVLNLRNQIFPVIKLYDFYDIPTKYNSVEDGIMLVIKGNNRQAALLVDEIVGYKQLVIKGLPVYMGSIRAISGCSILGDGDVSLILDSSALLSEVLE